MTLEEFNALPAGEAAEGLLACCASRRWAAAVAGGRPYGAPSDLRTAAAAALHDLAWADVEEALAAHPRIGERAAGTGREASWSRREQSGMDAAERAVRERLAAGNRRYEERFDHVFLICATGLGAAEMLAALERRLRNGAAAERGIVRAELGKIMRLRLDRLLNGKTGS
ncbi:2-oxo-4-hydroxy-4-carboxy-5-ureidoimidazoline decarboxylase [Actinomadura vinacea]|uniref:2-oxo-4-hydroxy-4-carboxy-5-ureidoimidazoline decarboxylase n=1 Tax=Actinomadura vinacea TaxID=115336 RepID=A0ABN3J0A6_9ACTN